jgi:tetratricopeptide (TPR) repeat protein
MKMNKLFCTLSVAGAMLGIGALAHGQDFQGQLDAAVRLYQDGNVSGSASAFEALRQSAPENADVNSWLGFLYLKMDRNSDAVAPLEKAVGLMPSGLDVLNNLGSAYMATGQYDRADDTFRRALAVKPDFFDAHYNMGNVAQKRGDHDAAIEIYRKALAINDNDPFVHNNLGVSLTAKGMDADAARHFSRAAELRPERALFHQNAGLAMLRSGNAAGAIPHLEAADRMGSNADVVVALAQAYSDTGQTEKAMAALQRAGSAGSGSHGIFYNEGVMHANAGHWAEAVEANRKALALNENNIDARNNLGIALYNTGQFGEAADQFGQVVTAWTDGGGDRLQQARVNLAAARARAGQVSAAIPVWKSILHSDSKRIDIRKNLANALYRAGDVDGAGFHYRTAIKQDANNSDALMGLGMLDYRKNLLLPAENHFRMAVRANRSNVVAWNNLGLTLERMNRKKEARYMMQQALALDPNYPEAKKNLDRLNAIPGVGR